MHSFDVAGDSRTRMLAEGTRVLCISACSGEADWQHMLVGIQKLAGAGGGKGPVRSRNFDPVGIFAKRNGACRSSVVFL